MYIMCVCTGGGYSFMQTALSEDSSTTIIQDFFSQFGKTDTSSNTDGAGAHKKCNVINPLFLTCKVYVRMLSPFPVVFSGTFFF